jgi:hypothetical protein
MMISGEGKRDVAKKVVVEKAAERLGFRFGQLEVVAAEFIQEHSIHVPIWCPSSGQFLLAVPSRIPGDPQALVRRYLPTFTW